MQLQNKFSISNILIGISAVFTIVASFDPNYYIYGMNGAFLSQGQYHIYALQFFSSQFLHGGPLHLIMNAIFIILFGNIVEQILGERKYLLFFIFSVLFIGLSITFLGSGNTVGISGFAMALLAYYTLHLKQRNNPDYKGGITALVINVLIGLIPGISLLGHLSGAIAGVIFYFLTLIKTKE